MCRVSPPLCGGECKGHAQYLAFAPGSYELASLVAQLVNNLPARWET